MNVGIPARYSSFVTRHSSLLLTIQCLAPPTRLHSKVGAEFRGFPEIDVPDLLGGTVGIEMQQDPNAARERPWYRHLVRVEQRDIGPADLARRHCREGGIQIHRCGK